MLAANTPFTVAILQVFVTCAGSCVFPCIYPAALLPTVLDRWHAERSASVGCIMAPAIHSLAPHRIGTDVQVCSIPTKKGVGRVAILLLAFEGQLIANKNVLVCKISSDSCQGPHTQSFALLLLMCCVVHCFVPHRVPRSRNLIPAASFLVLPGCVS